MAIIDVHAHLWAPPELNAMGLNLLGSDGAYSGWGPKVSDDRYLEFLQPLLTALDQVGTDAQIVSPRPFVAGHSRGKRFVLSWTRWVNDFIAQQVRLAPTRFVGMAGLPQAFGEPISFVFEEMDRCLDELGFSAIMINPDPSEGTGFVPPMGDPYWFPLYEKMIERDVPALIHSAGCCSGRETYANHFITEEAIATISLIKEGVLLRYPELKLIVAHGGGSVPYQIGRWRAERQPLSAAQTRSLGLDPNATQSSGGSFDDDLKRLYFDTALWSVEGLELLFKVAGPHNCCFGSERLGSGSQTNPLTGRSFDDMKPDIDAFAFLSDADRTEIYEGNARKLFAKLPV